jgi:cytochrome c oxidase assembly protein Cox11
MPVSLFVDSDLDRDIVNITLSYNFLKVKKANIKKTNKAKKPVGIAGI